MTFFFIQISFHSIQYIWIRDVQPNLLLLSPVDEMLSFFFLKEIERTRITCMLSI